MTPSGIVTLTSDFGTADGYAGALKGAVLERLPGARLVDLSHELAPGDVTAASHLLARAAPLFPPGTVHVAVVDPGVGTARRGLALRAGPQLFVGPDNGIFGGALEALAETPVIHVLENRSLWRASVSPVFHGRDVFGPVAGFLASGGELASVGPAISAAELVRLSAPVPSPVAGGLRGEVVHVDRFGNLVTNLRAPDAAPASLEVAGHTLPLSRTYGDVAPGRLVAVVGS
ncbi:MAG TPA: SAM-dependent chlorinase/fluorinase, partial [Myxococcota bacterium]|nr:SAM-dependent chlorinase/fluorinase [Myxococcota bacterium]